MDRSFSRVIYQIGGGTSNFTFPDPTDQFFSPHDAELFVSPNGHMRLLVHDVGNNRPASLGGPYTRALMLHLDTDAMTATKVWDYRLSVNTSCFTPSNGGGKKLDVGEGYLVDFGACDGAGFHTPSTSYTVQLDRDGGEVGLSKNFMKDFKSNYRSVDLQSIAGEMYV